MDILVDKTIDNGTIENVHIAPIGDFYGSKDDGSAVAEHITAESLQRIADDLNSTGEEVLMDIDHQSTREGNKKNTSAVGWFHRFVVDPVKGLFANLKLTKMGKELIENREYRYVSPTFALDEKGEPSMLHSVGATNLPAFKGHIKPILNAEAKEISTTENKDILTMTTEELTTLIKETVKSELQVLNSCADKKEEEVKNEEVVEETKKDEEVKEETKTEETKTEEVKEEEEEEEVKEEVKEEEVKEEPKTEEIKEEKEEVIKMEVLNSAPTPSMEKSEPWKNLHGKEFFDWLRKNS